MAEKTKYTGSYFVKGLNSYSDPAFLEDGAYRWAENMLNRGGILQTRPGFELVAEFEGVNPQGIHGFIPNDRVPRLLVAIDGQVHAAQLPGGVFSQVGGVQFTPYAPQIHFCDTIKTLLYTSDGYLQVQNPVRMVMMQDGIRQAAGWNGEDAGQHYDPSQDGPVIGTSMVWAASRLWIASGSRVHAMDLGDPTSNKESESGSAERGIFEMVDQITAMALTPDQSRLLVFTNDRTQSLVANVTDRASWQNIPDFQSTLYPTIGCVGPRAVKQHFGVLWWYSQYGLINYNYSLATLHDSEYRYQDNEMIRSKSYLAANKSGICMGSYDNFLLTAVPYGSVLNTQQWVIDQSVAETGRHDSPWVFPCVWTGIRPVAYASVTVNGQPMIYALSKDYDGVIRVWRLFADRWDDNGKRIYFRFESKRHQKGWMPMRLSHAELMLVELRDRWTMRVSWEGENTPAKTLNVVSRNAWNCYPEQACDECTSPVPFNLRFHSAAATSGTCSTCINDIPQGPIPDVTDYAHSLNVDGYGSIGIRAYRLEVTEQGERAWGECSPSQPEVPAADCEYRPIAPKPALRPVTPMIADHFYSSVPVENETEELT